MSQRFDIPAPAARRLVCARCGTEFACNLSSDCWCADTSVRLPLADNGADCLCADCLRLAAKPAAPH